jgi:hypothetical protein
VPLPSSLAVINELEQADKITRIREREFVRAKEVERQQREYYVKISTTQV